MNEGIIDGGYINKLFVSSPIAVPSGENNKIYLVEGGVKSVFEPLASAPFTLYPTPTYDNLTVKFDSAPLGAKIEIRDAAGKFVKSSDANEELVSVDLPGVAQGSYFAVISIGAKVWCAPFTVVR